MTRRPTRFTATRPAAAPRMPAAPRTTAARTADEPRGLWLTRAAFGLAVAVVVARVMMTEAVRSAIPVSPGAPNIPYGPGPSAGLWLDLLAGLCPVLVLVRRWVDPTYRLRPAGSALLFVALAAWAVASTAWAGDRFAAAVSSCHLLAAAGVLWAMAQVVRTAHHARLLAGLCAGLLAVLLTHGLWYQFVDRQELKHEWETNREQLLKARNIEPGTFEFTQFENKILRGELMGFSASPNTYAAQLVLLGLVGLGAAAQFVRDGRTFAAVVLAAVLLVAAGVLPLAQSRTATLTGVLGVLLVAAAVPLGGLLRRRATLFYWVGAAGVLAAVAFVVAYGLSRGTLFHDSLNFRWRYWVGSFSLWRLHPLLGVGWENFGPHYLGVRLPDATEEIKDPHNYLVRFLAELGAVGGALALAWTARAWWEITRPAAASDEPTDTPGSQPHEERRSGPDPRPTPDPRPGPGLRPVAEYRSIPTSPAVVPAHRPAATLGGIVAAIALGFVLNFLCAVDLAQESGYVAFEAIRRAGLLLVCLAVAGVVWLTVVRLGREPAFVVDASPAPLVRLGLTVGLGMFFVHNLIDFAMFEVGPMFLLAVLLGAAVGLAPRPDPAADRPRPTADPAAGPRRAGRWRAGWWPDGRRAARWAVAVTGATWLLGLVLVAVPIAWSEARAAEGDASLRANRTAVAARQYEVAFGNAVPNADYADRAARAWRWAGDPARARAMADRAVAAAPADAGLRIARAELAMAGQPPDLKPAADDYRDAVRLDPNNLAARRRYAELLGRLDRRPEAAAELRTVLALNDRLTQEERKRLPPAVVAEIGAAAQRRVLATGSAKNMSPESARLGG